jgi:TolB-like protein/tetratricopeptide (TPR) repeat protein
MSSIVVSYASADRERVNVIVSQLREDQYDIWIDKGGIEGASLWGEEIVEAIESAQVLLLMLSAKSVASSHVLKEVTIALEGKKHILPVYLEEVQLSRALQYPLAGVQHIDFFEDPTAGIESIERALARLGVVRPEPVHAGNGAEAPGEREVVLDDSRIMVLPFRNISPDKESDYFSDGLTQELIVKLGQLKEMKVLARPISMQYKETTKDVGTISKELGVRYLVEGSVRRHGDALRISAELIDAQSQQQVWADSFKGTMADVFDIQESVSIEIVDALTVELTPTEKDVLSKRSTKNAEAFDCYLRARDFLYRLTKENTKFAIQLFKICIDLDHQYAAAYAGIAEAYGRLYQLFDRNEEWLEKANTYSTTALMYDPASSEAYSALALVRWNRGKDEEALATGIKAVELAPDNYIARWILGRIHWTNDRPRQAAEQFETVLRLDPDFYTARTDLHLCYVNLGEKEKADEVRDEAIALMPGYLSQHPDDARVHMLYANLLSNADRLDDANVELTKALELSPNDSLMIYNAACIYAKMGDNERAVKQLCEAVDAGFKFIQWMLHDPDLQELKDRKDFQEMLSRVEIPA